MPIIFAATPIKLNSDNSKATSGIKMKNRAWDTGPRTAQNTPQRIAALVIVLAIVALSGCIRIQPHRQAFSPQAVTIDFPVTVTNATITAPNVVEEAVTSVDCASLCATVWSAAQEDEPYEIPANDTRIQLGDACRCLSGPGSRLNQRGAQ